MRGPGTLPPIAVAGNASMRHPFANPQYCRHSLSTDVIARQCDVRDGEHEKARLVRPEPAPRSSSTLPGAQRKAPPASSTRTSPTHFVKHSSRVTLLLSGQDEGVSTPVYTSGSTIDGILATPRSSGLLSLVVRVSARIVWA